MINFLETAVDMISNHNQVGFLKFSTNVTQSSWLPYHWKRHEFKQAIPKRFDDGLTNTPLALKTAKKMFEVCFW